MFVSFHMLRRFFLSNLFISLFLFFLHFKRIDPRSMGVLLCCFRVPDHEDEHDNNVSGISASHYQSSVGNNFVRKCEEALRNHVPADQANSNSQEPVPVSSFGTDLSQSSKLLSPKLQTHDNLSDNEDVCPTCFEDYTDQNPRVLLQCGHIFHLDCIYEWMERSEACPFCAKMMLFLET